MGVRVLGGRVRVLGGGEYMCLYVGTIVGLC